MRIVVVLFALLAVLACAAGASADFPQSAKLTVPAGGSGQITSSAIPASAKTGTVSVKPFSGSEKVFAELQSTLATGRTRGQRVLFCAVIYSLSLTPGVEGVDFSTTDPSLAYLFLKACLHLALTLPVRASQAVAAAGCPRQDVGVPMKVTKVGRRWWMHVKGRAGKPRSRSPLAVTCRRAGSGFQLSLRPRKRGMNLKTATGGNLAIGFVNRSTGRSVGVKTTFSVR